MENADWFYLFASILSFVLAMAQNHSVAIDTYYVSAGHLFLLKCPDSGANPNVTWSRGGGHNLSLPTGVEVRDGLLWILHVQASHGGEYTCEKRGGGIITMMVQVSSEECPDTSETVSIPQGVSGSLPCKQDEVFRLDGRKQIRWMKECRPTQALYVTENGSMRLPEERNAGKYTCLVDISVDGRNYTAARSIQLKIGSSIDAVAAEPQLLYPHDEVVMVDLGQRVELQCLALIGPSGTEHDNIYWTVNELFPDDVNELNELCEFFHDKGRVYGRAFLNISEVRPDFLDVPIRCHVRNAVGESLGLVRLQKVDRTHLYTTVALCLSGPLLLLALGAVFIFCKVDLVLANRKLLRHFSKQQAPDGKIYDGYVSFLNPKTQSLAEKVNFVLKTLPEELEQKHGYSLYIRGRDDCPGEAFHEAVAAAIHQCRRLIIVLSPEAAHAPHADKAEAALSTPCDERVQLCYEHRVGLHSALTQNNPRVILLEIDGPVDYSRLSESLRYIKRKQGALKFRTDSTGRGSNRNFWKNLRYLMPSVPAGKSKTVV